MLHDATTPQRCHNATRFATAIVQYDATHRTPGAPDDNPVVDLMPPTNHRVSTTVLHDATHSDAITQRDPRYVPPGAPDGNPVVDPVPPTNHRVITTVLHDAINFPASA